MTQQNKTEKIFADGLRFELPSEKAPEFIKGRLSFKAPEFIKFLEAHQSNAGWVNVTLKVGQSGKAYAELDTWKPTPKVEETKKKHEPLIDPMTGIDCNPEDAPF